MMPAERSFAAIVQEIVGSIRDIIRLEVQLAKAEVTESVLATRQAATMFAIGALSLLFTAEFLLMSAMYGLSLVIPLWAAALAVAGAMGIVGGICVLAAGKRLSKVHAPRRTMASLQETLQ